MRIRSFHAFLGVSKYLDLLSHPFFVDVLSHGRSCKRPIIFLHARLFPRAGVVVLLFFFFCLLLFHQFHDRVLILRHLAHLLRHLAHLGLYLAHLLLNYIFDGIEHQVIGVVVRKLFFFRLNNKNQERYGFFAHKKKRKTSWFWSSDSSACFFFGLYDEKKKWSGQKIHGTFSRTKKKNTST